MFTPYPALDSVLTELAAGARARASLCDNFVGAYLDERPDPWRKVHAVADRELVTRTLAFVDYAAEAATRFGGTRPAAR